MRYAYKPIISCSVVSLGYVGTFYLSNQIHTIAFRLLASLVIVPIMAYGWTMICRTEVTGRTGVMWFNDGMWLNDQRTKQVATMQITK